jgi:hypothetical protein
MEYKKIMEVIHNKYKMDVDDIGNDDDYKNETFMEHIKKFDDKQIEFVVKVMKTLNMYKLTNEEIDAINEMDNSIKKMIIKYSPNSTKFHFKHFNDNVFKYENEDDCIKINISCYYNEFNGGSFCRYEYGDELCEIDCDITFMK